MRKSLRANTVRTVVRATGRVSGSVELVREGKPEQHVSVTIGDVVCSVSDVETANVIRDGWESAGRLADDLPVGVAPYPHGAPGLYEVLTVLSFSGQPVMIAAMIPGRVERSEPTHLQIQVGPLVWQITDRNAYSSIRELWNKAYDLLAATYLKGGRR